MTSVAPPSDAPAQSRPASDSGPHLRVVVVTGDRVAYDGPADAVTALGMCGAATVLLHHAPMLTMLEPGEFVIHSAGQTTILVIGGGCLEIADDVVTVLAESAERPEDIDIIAAEATVRDAEAMSRRYRSRPEAAMLALRRARVRLRAARKARAIPGA